MHHPEHKGEEYHRGEHVAQRHQQHSRKADQQYRAAFAVIEHPADDGAAEHRDEREQRSGQPRQRLAAAEAFNIEWEGGQQHDVVHEDEKIDDYYQHKVPCPEPRLFVVHSFKSPFLIRKTS